MEVLVVKQYSIGPSTALSLYMRRIYEDEEEKPWLVLPMLV